MKIAFGSDHAGYEYRQMLMAHARELGHEVIDYGTFSKESCDYPVYGHAVGAAVANGEADRGILVCGTGIGMSMAANKHRGIRAACCSDYFSAKFTRAHNDANVLCLGGRVVGPGLACEIVNVFLNTPFEGGRHARRVAQIKEIEDAQSAR